MILQLFSEYQNLTNIHINSNVSPMLKIGTVICCDNTDVL